MTYYDSQYFNWQKKTGSFGAKAEVFKFKEYIKPQDKVIDFGCGGGFLLKVLNCSEKLGVEINQSARDFAINENKLSVVETINELENGWADVIISNHALEHTKDPFNVISVLVNKLRIGGLIIFVVPQEHKDKYNDKDVNQHLYTWTPLTLGNLFKNAGLKVISSKTLIHKWPPFYREIYRILGKELFNLISNLYCFITQKGYQVITVGQKN
jgi:SAM-dependent methyltransferase